MRFPWVLLCALSWLWACAAAAQAGPPRPFAEPGTVVAPSDPPPVGACIGGDCEARLPAQRAERPRARGGATYAAAIFGAVSAGLVLGGSIAIAAARDVDSERITRGLWLGYLAVSTPCVALAAHLGRRGGAFRGYQGLRRLGWTAYGLGVADGVLLWYGAFRDFDSPRVFTIGAGVIGALALLPHALEALVTARAARTRRLVVLPNPSGVAVRF